MQVYLVQHGEATSVEVNPERPLTEKGKADVGKIARFLKNSDIKLDAIWHSTKLRAKQTAEIIAEAIKPEQGIQQKENLAPLDTINKACQAINELRMNLMIVGHLPFLPKLTSMLLAGSETLELVSFKQGGVVGLEKKEKGWQLQWMIIPDLLK